MHTSRSKCLEMCPFNWNNEFWSKNLVGPTHAYNIWRVPRSIYSNSPQKAGEKQKKKLKIKVTRRVKEEKYWADTVETSVVELGGTVVVNQLLHLHSRNESWHCYTVFKSSPNSVVSLAENQSKQSLKPSRTNKTITPRSLSIIIDKLTWVKGILVLCCFFVKVFFCDQYNQCVLSFTFSRICHSFLLQWSLLIYNLYVLQ